MGINKKREEYRKKTKERTDKRKKRKEERIILSARTRRRTRTRLRSPISPNFPPVSSLPARNLHRCLNFLPNFPAIWFWRSLIPKKAGFRLRVSSFGHHYNHGHH